ncbi:MAG: glutathione S-transferase N-terminal domain-containing protein [Burkholderiales bacterium]
MKLYGSQFSPYVRKVRVLLAEKHIPYEFVLEDPWPDDSAIPTRNPLGKVPVLEIAPGRFLFESPHVVHYLDNLAGKPLQPPDPEGYWRSQWWQALGHGIIDATVARVLETRRPADKQMPEKMQREEARIARAFEAADHEFAGGTYLVSDSDFFTLADLVMGVACQYIDLRYPHEWRSKHPRLRQWLSGIAARPCFATTLPPGFIPVS